MKLRALPLAIATLTAASTTTAATTPTDTTLLNQVTVTATRTEQKVKDVASSVTVVDSEQIEQQHVNTIEDLTRYQPGVSTNSGTRTGHKDFNIRGMTGNRVKVAVDGVNQANNFDLEMSPYLRGGRNFVDLETLKTVEIVKGPASSLYGSDAIGGLVAFQTKDPRDILKGEEDQTSGSAKLGYSSANNGLTETLSLANRSGALESMVIYTHRDSQETKTYDTSGDNIGGGLRGEANPADNRGDNVLAKAQLQLNNDHRIGLTGEYFDQQNKVEVRDANPSGTQGTDTKKRTRIGFEHRWEHANTTLFDSLHWQLDWQKTETSMVTFVPTYVAHFGPTTVTMPNREQDYNYTEEGVQVQTQLSKTIDTDPADHQLIYGLNLAQDTVTNDNRSHNLDTNVTTVKDYLPPVKRRVYGLFVQDNIAPTKDLTITPGLRYDQYNYQPSRRFDGQEFTSSSGHAATGKLGAVYELNRQYSVFAQFSQGFKAPDLIDMFYSLSSPLYQLQANPNLKPETSNSIETGLRGHTASGDFEVTGFYNRYQDFIESVTSFPNPSNPGFFITRAENLKSAQIKGLEFKGQLYLDALAPVLTDFTLHTAIAWAKGEGEINGNTEPLNSISPLTAVFGLAYDNADGIWGSELLWSVAKGKDRSDISIPDNESRFASPGYGVVDLTGYYHVTDSLALQAGLFNIADKKYWHWNRLRQQSATNNNRDRFSQPGRNFSVSAKYRF